MPITAMRSSVQNNGINAACSLLLLVSMIEIANWRVSQYNAEISLDHFFRKGN